MLGDVRGRREHRLDCGRGQNHSRQARGGGRKEIRRKARPLLRLPQGARQAGRRRRHNRNPRPLALPAILRRLLRREGRLCRKADSKLHRRVRRDDGLRQEIRKSRVGRAAAGQLQNVAQGNRHGKGRKARQNFARGRLGEFQVRRRFRARRGLHPPPRASTTACGSAPPPRARSIRAGCTVRGGCSGTTAEG